MQQKGWKITGSTTIDDLKYHYRLNGNSNQLQNVIDMTNDVNTKLGDFRTSSNHTQLADKSSYVASPGSVNAYNITDYVYDANGNMIKDYNKDIGSSSNSGITYNHLNLPQTILLRNSNGSVKGAIDYVYNAAGIKLKKIVTDYQANKTITTITNYLNGFVYEDGTGVVLKTSVPTSTIVKSPSLKSINLKQAPGTIVNESEVLLRGQIKAQQIIKL